MTKRAAILAAASAIALATAPPAHAGFGFSVLHMQPYYAGQHHWYTNDGRRLSDDFQNGGSPTVDVHHSRHNDREDNSNENRKRLHERVTTACDRLHGLYIIRHGFNKPSSLRREFGCELWADDAFYHDTHPTEALDAFGIGN